MVGLLAWAFVVENLLFGFVPTSRRFGPVHAGEALSGLGGPHDLSPAAGGAVLVAWAAALTRSRVSCSRPAATSTESRPKYFAPDQPRRP